MSKEKRRIMEMEPSVLKFRVKRKAQVGREQGLYFTTQLLLFAFYAAPTKKVGLYANDAIKHAVLLFWWVGPKYKVPPTKTEDPFTSVKSE